MKKRQIRLGRTLLVNKEFEQTLFMVRHPLIAGIILGTIFFVWLFIISVFTGTITSFSAGMDTNFVVGVNAAFNGLTFVILFEGFLILAKDMTFGKNTPAAFIMAIPFIMMLVVYGVIFKGKPSLSAVGLALFAGFAEEITFRFIPVVCFKRPGVKKISDVKIALFSAIAFAIYHIPNVIVADNPIYEILGVVFAFCTGFYFAGLYLRTGSLLTVIILHTVNNVIAEKVGESFVGGIISVLYGFLLLAFTVSVLRREDLFERPIKFIKKILGRITPESKKPKKPVVTKSGYYKKSK